MLQICERQPCIQFIEWDEMFFVQLILRFGRREIERAKVYFLRTVFGLKQQRQALGATDERTGSVNSTTVIHQHRTGDGFAMCFAFVDRTSLLFDPRTQCRGQFGQRCFDARGLDGKDRKMMLTAAAASGAAGQMCGVSLSQLLGQRIYGFNQLFIRSHRASHLMRAQADAAKAMRDVIVQLAG